MNPDTKIMNETKNTLLKFGNKYLTDKGSIKKFNLVNDLDDFNKELMSELFNNKTIYNNFVEKINNIDVFKINQFIEMFQYKDFWKDSYTKYSNMIGLTAENKFISDSADVVLDFPYKDCVLAAGMTKEDSKDNNEPFLNQTIAKPEIDELLEPKVFINTKKIDKNGEHSINDFLDDDNLIIKGNNLIALNSLKNKYYGKIKFIYLDPPYYFKKNKKSDTFPYNPNFKLSSWLTFMQNRLSIAKDLLKDDGVIAISMGEDGQAYLKLLMDNVFGKDNFVETFLWRNTSTADSISNKSRSGVEYIHAYEKIRNDQKWLGKQSENGDAPLFNNGNSVGIRTFPKGSVYFKTADKTYKKGEYDSSELLDDIEIINNKNSKPFSVKAHFKWSQNTIDEEIKKGTYFLVKTNKFSIRFQRKDASFMSPEKWIDEPYLSKALGVGTNENSTAHLKQLQINFTNPKPESLLEFFIRAVTKENDFVMDFFMGSATTQAVSMKMNRHFIGIEQMDYINTLSVKRLKKVIDGEQGEISENVHWNGGGSFVYTELMEKNYKHIRKIQNAKDINDLNKIYESIRDINDINITVNLDKFDQTKDKLDFEEFKKSLLEMLDKNQLYYNYSNIEDNDVKSQLSEYDYKFNKNFYK